MCTVVVLVLVAAALVTGIRFAVKSYVKSVSLSEAQVLCSTLTTVVSDELRYAGTVTVDQDGNLIGFFSRTYGTVSGTKTAFSTDADGRIVLGKKEILSRSAYTYGEKAKVSVQYSAQSGSFSVDLSITASDNTVLAQNQFEIKPVNTPVVTVKNQ